MFSLRRLLRALCGTTFVHPAGYVREPGSVTRNAPGKERPARRTRSSSRWKRADKMALGGWARASRRARYYGSLAARAIAAVTGLEALEPRTYFSTDSIATPGLDNIPLDLALKQYYASSATVTVSSGFYANTNAAGETILLDNGSGNTLTFTRIDDSIDTIWTGSGTITAIQKLSAYAPQKIGTSSLTEGTMTQITTASTEGVQSSSPVSFTAPSDSYEFYFQSQNDHPILYSNGPAGHGARDAMITLALSGTGTFAGLSGSYVLGYEDGGDADYQDLIVQLTTDGGPVAITNVHLEENANFLTKHTYNLTIPSSPQGLVIDYSDLSFDTTSTGRMKDAFELALVDDAGKSLVPTVGLGRDAFFSITESHAALQAAGVGVDSGQVLLDVSGLAPGTHAHLIARLVNDDADTATEVTLPSLPSFVASTPTDTPSVLLNTNPLHTGQIDFSALSDVTGFFSATYQQTAFDTASGAVSTNISSPTIPPPASAGRCSW
jgi:hypothetical protein